MINQLTEPEGECIVQVGMRFFHHRDGRPGSIGWYDLERQSWETWDGLCELGWPHIYPLTEVEPPLPPEPPVGSVVLDAAGQAWQRIDDGDDRPWLCAHPAADEDWAELNTAYGPLTYMTPRAVQP